jgi:hypothetical protein
MKHLKKTSTAFAVAACTILLASAAWSESRPDFNDHDAVVAAINDLTGKCGSDQACIEVCKASAETAPKYQDATPINRRLRQNLWHACMKKQPASAPVAKATPKPEPKIATQASFDQSKIVIAGLQLGGQIQDAFDRINLMEADGYYKAENRERGSGTFRWSGTDTEGQLPDIVETYQAQINDKNQGVYIHLEAIGDGTIYKIMFNQKGAIDPEAANAAIVERFGPPTKVAGRYLYWGCEDQNLDVCVKADATKFVFEIFAQDVRIKEAWRPVYHEKMGKEKGVKPGLQF